MEFYKNLLVALHSQTNGPRDCQSLVRLTTPEMDRLKAMAAKLDTTPAVILRAALAAALIELEREQPTE